MSRVLEFNLYKKENLRWCKFVSRIKEDRFVQYTISMSMMVHCISPIHKSKQMVGHNLN
mgnify:CR=1 FL=1